ncbi:hypothetical protein BDZ89DRAFT_1202370, partial [Hymenopellis radicata]
DTNVDEVSYTNVAELEDTDVDEVEDTDVDELEATDVDEVEDTGVDEVQDTNVDEVSGTGAVKVEDADEDDDTVDEATELIRNSPGNTAGNGLTPSTRPANTAYRTGGIRVRVGIRYTVEYRQPYLSRGKAIQSTQMVVKSKETHYASLSTPAIVQPHLEGSRESYPSCNGAVAQTSTSMRPGMYPRAQRLARSQTHQENQSDSLKGSRRSPRNFSGADERDTDVVLW